MSHGLLNIARIGENHQAQDIPAAFGNLEGSVMSFKQLVLILLGLIIVQPAIADEDEQRPQPQGLQQTGDDETAELDDPVSYTHLTLPTKA